MLTRSSSRSEKMGSEISDTLHSIQQEMAMMKRSLNSLHTEVTSLKTELETIKDLKVSLEFTDKKVTEVETNVSHLQKVTKEQGEYLVQLESRLSKNQLENLECKEKQLQQESYNRRENLKFSGIQEEGKESYSQTVNKIVELFSQTLKIKDAHLIRFQRCHRLGIKPKKMSTPRDIIVRFVFFQDREKIWENRQLLAGTNIIMSEDFPSEIESRRTQLYPILKVARKNGYKCKLVVDKLIINGQRYRPTYQTVDRLPADIHPKNQHQKITEKAALFYGGYSTFSSFNKVNIKIDGKMYNSCEQFYQYQKANNAGNEEIASKILTSDDPREQYQLGKKVIIDNENWDTTKAKGWMEKAIKAKFNQNEPLKHELLNTGNKILVQCNQYEKLWSCGLAITSGDVEDSGKWPGENVIGTVLMEVRESLK